MAALADFNAWCILSLVVTPCAVVFIILLVMQQNKTPERIDGLITRVSTNDYETCGRSYDRNNEASRTSTTSGLSRYSSVPGR